MSGGMVAGLDAGLIYNTFPHMGDDWIPNGSELMSQSFPENQINQIFGGEIYWKPNHCSIGTSYFCNYHFLCCLGAHIYVNKTKVLYLLLLKE